MLFLFTVSYLWFGFNKHLLFAGGSYGDQLIQLTFSVLPVDNFVGCCGVFPDRL